MLRSHYNTSKFHCLAAYSPLSFKSTSAQSLQVPLRRYLHAAAPPCAPLTPPRWRPLRNTPILRVDSISFSRDFHSSHPIEAPHMLPLLIGVFKSSITINCVLGAVRIALTLVPMALLGKHGSHKWIRKLDRTFKDNPAMQAYRPKLMRHLKYSTIAIQVLLIVPTLLFALVMLASMERTPLTGRLRLIILSPDEEESITRDLSGPGWFAAINDVLTTSRGKPNFIPPTDWRYLWVERILRRLESVVPKLQDTNADSAWFDRGAGDLPYPPPADYPLVARPRMAQSLHYIESRGSFQHQSHHIMGDVPPRSVLGPPYSLLVHDQPDQSNAFSYGFGPNGSGGLVIFSGFLDEIINNTGGAVFPKDPRRTSVPTFLARIFSPSTTSPATPMPTPAQDAQLAILVAHELAHLLLSHHLETLSSGNIFWPSLTSIIADLFRALLFPITMVGGPFINDALEQVGEVGKREVATAADSCSSQLMEIEADIVSIRLLALAGWDARSAADFWEGRLNRRTADCASTQTQAQLPGILLPGSLWVSQRGDLQQSGSHPVDALRVQKLREELERWEKERKRASIRANQEKAIET